MELPSDVVELFNTFVSLANLNRLHDLDWNRFYEFIIGCHRSDVNLSEPELRDFLVTKNFEREYARNIAHVYAHGRDLLKLI
jgi:hypothetical protein